MGYTEVDTLAINTIRGLAIDAVAAANSGHPGAPMGLAPVSHVLFNKFMTFNPKNPSWINRDRFVLSNGHACALQYSLLHLFGYGISIDDLKAFRQVDSITPGHPEAHGTPGIEVTTGPLGQGFSNAVGLAIAQQHIAAKVNKPGFDLINNHTYTIFGDGCAMEGIASEAASLAGHLQLGNLITIYDDNKITIDGSTEVAFTEDVGQRFESYKWHVQKLTLKKSEKTGKYEGEVPLEEIEAAIQKAKDVKDKPSVIILQTIIGYGSKEEGTHGVHGSPLKADDIKQFKTAVGFAKPDEAFFVDPKVYELYGKHAAEGAAAEQEWNNLFEKYGKEYKDEHAEFARQISGKLPEGWEKLLPVYDETKPAIASRKLSEAVLQAIHEKIPELLSGSADLTGSNNTIWKGAKDFQPPSTGLGDWTGRYFRYGVREHAMAAIMNGLSAYGGLIPAGGTFLNFMSYAAGAVRLSALSHHQVIYIATHDSIGLGEDGPTHQPIEVLAHFRALPNIHVWRPADGNETSDAYYSALTARKTPSIIALTRQNLPQLKGSKTNGGRKGGYVVLDFDDSAEFKDKPKVVLVSTGSEVSICIASAETVLKKQGINARVVSLPCMEVFDAQPKDYKLSVIPDGVASLSVEVMSTHGWEKYSHEQFGLNRFGASGPYKKVYEKFEFTEEGIAKRAAQTVEFYKDVKPLRSPLNRAFEQLI